MSMTVMLELAEKYFLSCAWRHSHIAGRDDLIEVVFDNPRATWKSYAKASGDRAFLFYSVCAVDIPEARRPAVAEFITRVNFGRSAATSRWTGPTARSGSRPASS
jgi:hypothetical protein